MAIKLELQISPYAMRDAELWKNVAELAGSKTLLFRERYDILESQRLIIATCGEDPEREGVATISLKDLKDCYTAHDREKLVIEAIRFAAWKLIHGDEEEEDE